MKLSSYISDINCSAMLIEVSKHSVDQAPFQNFWSLKSVESEDSDEGTFN